MSKYSLDQFTYNLKTNSWDRVPRDPVTMFVGHTLFGAGVLTAGQMLIAQAIVFVGASLVTGYLLNALMPKGPDGSRELTASVKDAAAPREIVYGEVRKGGVITHLESTDDNKYLHMFVALAGHEIESVESIYINDEDQTANWARGSGLINGGSDTDWKNKVRVFAHLGAQTSASDTFEDSTKTLANTYHTETELSDVNSNFIGKGVAYLYVRHEYDKDVYADGIPEISVVVRGKKVQNTSGVAQTYPASANAALVIRDYLINEYGVGDDSTNIDATTFATAQTVCDTSSGSGDANKFEVNGVLSTGSSRIDNLETLTAACGGALFWGSGKWKLKAAAFTSSVKTLTMADLRGNVQIDTKHSVRDNFNAVQGTFFDKDQDWIEVDYPEIAPSAYLTEDNNEKNVLDLPFQVVTNSAQAQRLAKLTLNRHREQITFTANFGLEAFDLEVGDVVKFNDYNAEDSTYRYGFYSATPADQKTFEVIGWKFAPVEEENDLQITLTLRETSSTAFDWNAEEVTIVSNNTNLPNFSDVSPINGLKGFNTGYLNEDGNFVPRFTLDWDNATGNFFDHYEVQHKNNFLSNVTLEQHIDFAGGPTTTSGATVFADKSGNGKTAFNSDDYAVDYSVETGGPTGTFLKKTGSSGSGLALLTQDQIDALDTTNGFGHTFWFRHDSRANTASQARLYTRDASDYGALYWDTNGHFSNTWTTGTVTLTEGEWYFFYAARAGSVNTLKVYAQDGTEVKNNTATRSFSTDRGIAIFGNSEDSLQSVSGDGEYYNLNSDNDMRGSIADIRLHDGAILTDAQVLKLLSGDTGDKYDTINTQESRTTVLGYEIDDTVAYRVRAVNSSGFRSDFTSGTLQITGDDTAPSAPTSFTATGIFAGVNLDWINPDVSDFDVVEVYRNTTNSSSTATKIAEVKTDNFSDTNLSVNTTYYYWLKARDRTGNKSDFSAIQSAVTTYVTESNIDPTYINSVDTAAESAAAAEAAQTAAETAETNAETAQTAAESARNAAQTAQTAAETARDAQVHINMVTNSKTATDALLANMLSSSFETSTTYSLHNGRSWHLLSTTSESSPDLWESILEDNFPITLEDSQTWTWGFYAYQNTGSTQTVGAAFAGDGGWGASTTSVPDSTWTLVTGTGTSNSSGSYISTNQNLILDLRNNISNLAGNLWIDQVMVVLGDVDLSAVTVSEGFIESVQDASDSATAAATSATSASTSASAAATSATSAATSATTATTKASEASTSATNAATSATNASGSASSASTSATTAANSLTSIQQIESQIEVVDFRDNARHWAHHYNFAKDTLASRLSVVDAYSNVTIQNVSGVGDVLQATGYRIMTQRLFRPFIENQKFRVKLRTRLTQDPTSGTGAHRHYLWLTGFDADGSAGGYTTSNSKIFNNLTVADGWVDREWEFEPYLLRSQQSTSNDFYDATEWALMVGLNGYDDNTGGAIQQFAYVQIEDITSEDAAADSASAAATSASSASTSASNAASSATAAASSATSASTSASTATTKASEAATSATNASGSASSAATSATTAANARKRVQLVDGGVFNAGFELGTNGDAGAPAGWEVGSDHSNAFTVIGHHDSVNSSSPYASELCYGSDTTSAGDWWYIAKYFVAEPSQQFRVNAYVWLGDTHSDPNGADPKFVDEDDWIVVARWYDEDGALLSSSASRSAASYYNNANGTTDAAAQTWFQYLSDYLTAPSNTAYVKIEIAAVDANDTVISGNLYDYQTSSAFLGGNAHVRIDDVVFESNNGQVLEIQKSALDSAVSAAAAATSETNAAASETAAGNSASAAATSATNAETAYEGTTLTNMVDNGLFAGGKKPTGAAGLTASTTYAHTGSYSGKAGAAQKQYYEIFEDSSIPIAIGETYTWGFWVYNANASNVSPTHGFAGGGGWATKTQALAAGAWTFVYQSGTVPSGGIVALENRSSWNSAYANLYYDEIMMVKGDHDLSTIAVDHTAATSAANASTSETNAATSESNAAGSASSASTSATNASNSATNASNSASAASTSASAASTSASNAASSATSASTSASTATTKAGEASTSATNAASSATDADTSALSATRTATRQSKLNHAAGMLAPQICLKAASYKFAVWEDDTTIYKNGVELVTLDRGSRTSWTQTLALGDRLTSSKPFYAVSVSNDPYTIPLASEAMADTRFYFLANRYDTQTVNIYPLADGNAHYTYSSSHVGTTPVTGGTDISLTAGTVTTLNPVWDSGTDYFNISSDVPILVVKYGTSGDGALLMPPSESVFLRQGGPVVWVDSGSATSSSVDNVWYSSSDGQRRLAAFGTADGSGGDAEGHIGIEALGDEYVLPCGTVNNIWLMSPEECVVTVKNQDGTVEATFNLTGSADQESGSSYGNGGALYGDQGPYYLSGTKPFALQAQLDSFADEEIHYGFRRDLKPRYGTEAITEILQSSVTDLEGNQSASIVLRAKAGTGGAQLELVAGDNVSGGSASTARLAADDIILDGSVTIKQTRNKESDTLYNEQFQDLDELEAGFFYEDAAQKSIVTGVAGSTGNSVLRIGNNTLSDGADDLWWASSQRFPINRNEDITYKITVRARQTGGTGTAYFGLALRNQDDTSWINTSNSTSSTLSSSHYIAGSGIDLNANNTNFNTYVGYFNAQASTYIGGATDSSNPSGLANNGYWFSPMMLIAHNDAASQVDIDYFKIERMTNANLVVEGSITADQISSSYVYAGNLNATQINAGTIDANRISVNSLSSLTANMGTLTAGNIQLGNLAVNSDMEPTSGSGILIESDGDMAVGNPDRYFAWDSSAGNLTVFGELINIQSIEELKGEFVATTNSSNSFLPGESGEYFFVLIGAGGGGGVDNGISTNRESHYGAAGGGAGGVAIFKHRFNDEVNQSYVLTLGAGGVTNRNVSSRGSWQGNTGGVSSLTFNDGTNNVNLATVNGGTGGYQTTGGSGGNSSINTNAANLVSVAARTGGSGGSLANFSGGMSGGGAPDLFGNGTAAGFCTPSNGASSGGSCFGQAATGDTRTGNNNGHFCTLPATFGKNGLTYTIANTGPAVAERGDALTTGNYLGNYPRGKYPASNGGTAFTFNTSNGFIGGASAMVGDVDGRNTVGGDAIFGGGGASGALSNAGTNNAGSTNSRAGNSTYGGGGGGFGHGGSQSHGTNIPLGSKGGNAILYTVKLKS